MKYGKEGGRMGDGWEEGKSASFPGPLSLKFSEWELGNPSQEKKVIQVVTVRSIVCGAYGNTRLPFWSFSSTSLQ